MKVVNNGLTITINGAMGHFPKEFVVSALEKQIPKKVEEFYRDFEAKCPSCEHRIEAHASKIYCCYCGQALDWGGE